MSVRVTRTVTLLGVAEPTESEPGFGVTVMLYVVTGTWGIGLTGVELPPGSVGESD